MTAVEECHRACDAALASYTGLPVPVELPEGLTIQELHGVVTFWRSAGWTADVDSSSRFLTIG